MLAGPYVFGATPDPGGRKYRLHRRCLKSGCRRFRVAVQPGRPADRGDRARRTGHYPFPARGLMTRAAWLVPARDGGPGTHEPGSGPGEATPDRGPDPHYHPRCPQPPVPRPPHAGRHPRQLALTKSIQPARKSRWPPAIDPPEK